VTRNWDGSYTAKAKPGYSFLGWYDSGGKIVFSRPTYTPNKAGIAPRFKAQTFAVKFRAKGGKFKKGRAKYTLLYGKKIPRPKVTRKGYRFKGWYRSGQKLKSGAKVKKNASYTARWTKIKPKKKK